MVREYDRYGRITRLVHPDFTTVYTYAEDEDLLLSAVSDNGTATYYTYDAYGRVESVRKKHPTDTGWRRHTDIQKTECFLPSPILHSTENSVLNSWFTETEP